MKTAAGFFEAVDAKSRPDRYQVAAAARVLSLLSALSELGSLSLGQAAEAAGVSSSTAYRLLITMERQGYVQRVGRRGFRIGPAAVSVARGIEAQSDLLSAAQEVARELSRVSDEWVRVALLGDTSIVLAYGLNGPDEVWGRNRDEITFPVHATAMGRAVAAYLDPARLSKLLGDEPYRAMTQRTATTWPDLRAVLDEVRTKGYAIELEESAPGVACVAVPLFRDSRVVGAIGIEVTSDRLGIDRVDQLAELLRQAASKITVRFAPIRLSVT